MNLLIKLPAILGINFLYTIWPGSERLFEKYIKNIYYFGADHNKYSRSQFTEFSQDLEKHVSLKDKVLLEIGPGGFLGLGLLALKNGSEAYYAIDSGNHLEINNKVMKSYVDLLENKSLVNKVFRKKNGGFIFNRQFIKFFDISRDSHYNIPRNCVDIIYSCAALEHVHDLDLCFREMSRVLKPGGLMYHIVDLRDHIFSQESLYFMSIPDFWFNLLFKNTGSFTNRKRYSYYSGLFRRYGLEVVDFKKQVQYSGKIPPGLINKYQENDLRLLTFRIILRKKHNVRNRR